MGKIIMHFLRAFTQRLKFGLLTVLLSASMVFATSPAFANTVSVAMGEGGMLSFTPAEVQVAPGDTVHFDVVASAPHNVVFDAANSAGDVDGISHQALEMSGGFDVTFPSDAAKGEYPYYCEPHRGAGMVGKVIVQ